MTAKKGQTKSENSETPKRETKSLQCKSCGTEFSTKKASVTKQCPHCNQASVEVKPKE